jgi:orotate phosphoribosyltransferase
MLALPYGFVSLAHLTETLRQNLHRIPHDIDLVVGIPRSVIIPAYAIALYLNLLAIDLSAFLENRPTAHGFSRTPACQLPAPLSAKRILLVDDSFNTGKSMHSAVASIRDAGFAGEILTCAIMVPPEPRQHLEIFFVEMPLQRIFEWNLFQRIAIETACIDYFDQYVTPRALRLAGRTFA